MTGRKVLCVLAVASALMACSSSTKELPVRTRYDSSTVFQDWKTFRFASEQPESRGSRYPRYQKMLQQALDQELTARGYSRIEDGTPEFRVSYELSFRGDSTPQVNPQGAGADPMARSHSGPTPSGSLIIRMLDPVSSQILWTGSLAELKVSAIEPQKQLNKAVWRILVEFPPITG